MRSETTRSWKLREGQAGVGAVSHSLAVVVNGGSGVEVNK